MLGRVQFSDGTSPISGDVSKRLSQNHQLWRRALDLATSTSFPVHVRESRPSQVLIALHARARCCDAGLIGMKPKQELLTSCPRGQRVGSSVIVVTVTLDLNCLPPVKSIFLILHTSKVNSRCWCGYRHLKIYLIKYY